MKIWHYLIIRNSFLKKDLSKMKIKITSDTSCDMTPELIQKYNIGLLPIPVMLGEKEYRDGVDVTVADLYDYIDKTGQLPKTASYSPVEAEEFFRTQLATDGGYDAIVHFSLSSGISSICQNAMIASGEFENKVFVVDSLSLSTGVALQVIRASEMAKQGLTASKIFEEIMAARPLVQVSFVLDKLKMLYKGGRCSALALFGANLLNIKPSIIMKDGKLGVGKKFRGRYAECVMGYVEDILANNPNFDKKRVFLTHTDTDPSIVEAVRKRLTSVFDEVLETTAGCTIACHCGKNTLGILFYNKPEK